MMIAELWCIFCDFDIVIYPIINHVTMVFAVWNHYFCNADNMMGCQQPVTLEITLINVCLPIHLIINLITIVFNDDDGHGCNIQLNDCNVQVFNFDHAIDDCNAALVLIPTVKDDEIDEIIVTVSVHKAV